MFKLIQAKLSVVYVLVESRERCELKVHLKKPPITLRRSLDARKGTQKNQILVLSFVLVEKRGDWVFRSPCFQLLVIAEIKT